MFVQSYDKDLHNHHYYYHPENTLLAKLVMVMRIQTDNACQNSGRRLFYE